MPKNNHMLSIVKVVLFSLSFGSSNVFLQPLKPVYHQVLINAKVLSSITTKFT